jgi:hypothetical protein
MTGRRLAEFYVQLPEPERAAFGSFLTAIQIGEMFVSAPVDERVKFGKLLASSAWSLWLKTGEKYFAADTEETHRAFTKHMLPAMKSEEARKRKKEQRTIDMCELVDNRPAGTTIDAAIWSISQTEAWKGTEPSSIRSLYFKQRRKNARKSNR